MIYYGGGQKSLNYYTTPDLSIRDKIIINEEYIDTTAQFENYCYTIGDLVVIDFTFIAKAKFVHSEPLIYGLPRTKIISQCTGVRNGNGETIPCNFAITNKPNFNNSGALCLWYIGSVPVGSIVRVHNMYIKE